MSILDEDYHKVLVHELEEKNFNVNRLFQESKWWEELWKEIDIWEKEGTFDLFTKTFNTKTKWRVEKQLRSPIQIEFSNGKPIAMQWILIDGMTLHMAVKRIQQTI